MRKKYKDIKLVISVIGQVDVGKTTLINKVLGAEYGSVSPVPGWTKNVEIYNFADDVVIADTPGLEDMNKSNTQKTLEFLESSDILLYMFNATVGVTEPQKDSFRTTYQKARPTLVILNKIDAEKKWKKVRNHAIRVLDFNNIIGISAENGKNIKKILNWLITTLEKTKKQLLLEKILRPQIVSIIRKKFKHSELANSIEFFLKQTSIKTWAPNNLNSIEELERFFFSSYSKNREKYG